jgi:hypothetical protein
LNQVATLVDYPGDAPDREEDANQARDGGIEENITTRGHRLHIAVLQDPLVKGAGDDECLLFPIAEIR